jgi:hypothetical protein
MGKLGIWFIAAGVAVICSTAAWAVTDGSFTATDEQGKPIDGATVTVTVKPDPAKPATPATHPPVVEKLYNRTSATGRAEVPLDEKKTSRNDDIVLIVLRRGGMTWTATVPLSSLGGGVRITFTPGPSSVATRTPTSTYTPMPWQGPVPFTGFGLSGFLSINYGEQTNREFLADTLTNTLDDANARLGGGIGVVYNFPVSRSFLAGPFVNVNFPNQSIMRTFPGGGSIGTTNTAVVTFGGNFAVPFKLEQMPAIVFLQIGASETQQNLKINFAMPSIDSRTIWGTTIGIGAAIQPKDLRIAGKPVSLFAQLNGTFWQDGRHVGNPFTYLVHRDDITAMAGATLWLSPEK